jgi:hypothetical protein
VTTNLSARALAGIVTTTATALVVAVVAFLAS